MNFHIEPINMSVNLCEVYTKFSMQLHQSLFKLISFVLILSFIGGSQDSWYYTTGHQGCLQHNSRCMLLSVSIIIFNWLSLLFRLAVTQYLLQFLCGTENIEYFSMGQYMVTSCICNHV